MVTGILEPSTSIGEGFAVKSEGESGLNLLLHEAKTIAITAIINVLTRFFDLTFILVNLLTTFNQLLKKHYFTSGVKLDIKVQIMDMPIVNFNNLKSFLDQKVELYNQPSFIKDDPISVPHKFTLLQDKEIIGFFAAIFAWGQRPTIIKKCIDLAERMDNAPFDFIQNHQDSDLKQLLDFKHRTFNDTDLLYCIEFFKMHYTQNESLETAFFPKSDMTVEQGLDHFHEYFFSLEDAPQRTRKHIPSPKRKSACKRLNMYFRWMVRNDNRGVDFGLWNAIKPKDLICPLDLHVERTAKKLGLLTRDKPDWQAAIELTENLRLLDPTDPIKYDFALFGVSIEEKCVIDMRDSSI